MLLSAAAMHSLPAPVKRLPGEGVDPPRADGEKTTGWLHAPEAQAGTALADELRERSTLRLCLGRTRPDVFAPPACRSNGGCQAIDHTRSAVASGKEAGTWLETYCRIQYNTCAALREMGKGERAGDVRLHVLWHRTHVTVNVLRAPPRRDLPCHCRGRCDHCAARGSRHEL